jgi:hypothetical protein
MHLIPPSLAMPLLTKRVTERAARDVASAGVAIAVLQRATLNDRRGAQIRRLLAIGIFAISANGTFN